MQHQASPGVAGPSCQTLGRKEAQSATGTDANIYPKEHPMTLSCASLANSLGLILDIAGVLLLWNYRLREALDRTGEVHLVTDEVDQEDQLQAATYHVLER